jgi:hypothetical protein
VGGWNQDGDRPGCCEQSAPAKLPADEQKGITRLRADLAALLNTAEEKTK